MSFATSDAAVGERGGTEPTQEDDDSSSHGPDFDTYRPSSVMQLGWPELDYDGHVQQIQVVCRDFLEAFNGVSILC